MSRKDSPPAGTLATRNAPKPPSGMLPRGASAPRASTHVVGDPTGAAPAAVALPAVALPPLITLPPACSAPAT